LREKFGIIIENENYFPDLWDKNMHPKHIPIATFRNLTLRDKFSKFDYINLEISSTLPILNFETLAYSREKNFKPYYFPK
jgi:hypothetical protein